MDRLTDSEIDNDLYVDDVRAELRATRAQNQRMLDLLREVAECEADDIMPVLPFELQDRVRALVAEFGA